MVNGYMNVKITISDENGIGTETDIDNVTNIEMLAAIGTLGADIIKHSKGYINLNMITRAIKDCYENDL